MADFDVNVTGTIANDSVTNAKLANMAQGTIKMRASGVGTGDPVDGTPDQASTVLDAATDPFVRTSALPAGGGDVVGPASSTNNNIPQWDGTTGKLLKDGLGTSLGGNGATDSTKLAQFGTQGQLRGTNSTSTIAAITAESTGGGKAGLFYGTTTINELVSISEYGPAAGLRIQNTGGGLAADLESSAMALSVHAAHLGVGTPDIAEFVTGLAGTPKLNVKFDGGLEWGSTGAQTTRNNVLPSKTGNALEFLRVNAGETDWETAAPTVAVGDITGLGTGVATALAVNVGTAGAPVVNGGALGTPSSGTLTNATGLPLSGLTGGADDDIVQKKAGVWTNRTMAQLASDLAAAGVAIRTGSTIAFDLPAVYNDPTTPSSGAVTLDLTGAIAGVEVVAFFNHSTEPTWPAGVTAYGTWYNSNTNVVRFLYIDASNISATIQNDRPVSEWRIVRKTSPTTRTSTTTLAADPTLTIPIDASQSVIIRGVVYMTSGSTPDFKYRITGPAGASEVRIDTINRAASGSTGPANLFDTAYHTADQVWTMAATGNGAVNVYIEVVNGATPGNIAFEWAQNTSDASNTTVRQNSWLEYQYGA